MPYRYDRSQTEKVYSQMKSTIQKLKQYMKSNQKLKNQLELTQSSLEKRKKEVHTLRAEVRVLKDTKQSLENRKQEVYRLRDQVREHRQDRLAMKKKHVTTEMLELIKRLIDHKHKSYARSLAQTMYYHGNRKIGAVCWAYQAYRDGFSELTYRLLADIEEEYVLHYLPTEYVTTMAEFDHDKFLEEEPMLMERLGAHSKLILAQRLYELKDVQKSFRWLNEIDIERLDEKTQTRFTWMQEQLSKKVSPEPDDDIDPSIPTIAVLDYKNIEYDKTSANLGDYTQTLAFMSNLARFTNVRYQGELSDFLTRLQGEVEPSDRIEKQEADVALSVVNRDFTSSKAHSEPKWLFAFGWYMHSSFNVYDFPFSKGLRPLFISFHVNRPDMLDEQAIAYLKEYAPIGCRDWSTVYLLNSLGIDSFFSGCVTTTLSNIFPSEIDTDNKTIGIVDASFEEDEDVEVIKQVGEDFRRAPIAENIVKSYEKFQSFRKFRKIRTSRLHSYLPSRSIGIEVEFLPKNPADIRFDGLAPIDDEAFDRIRDGIKSKLAEILTEIYSGSEASTVYERWQALCADDVTYAKAVCADIDPTPKTNIDLETVIKESRQRFVYLNQKALDDADRVKLAFAFDDNLRDIFPIVLESIIDNTSSSLQLFLLVRGIEQAFFDEVASHYPDVEFVIIDLTSLDYGEGLRLLSHISESTMDRLLLPDLLPEESKILYLDLDIIVLGDVAELYHTELGDLPLAGRSSKFLGWKYIWQMIYRGSSHLEYHDARYLRKYASSLQNILHNGYNAGVLVLNLERMRQDDLTHRFVPLIEQYKLNDQDALNLYTGLNRVQLENRWNFVPSQDMLDDPQIVHWAGPAKPWKDDYVPYKERYLYYSDRSKDRMDIK